MKAPINRVIEFSNVDGPGNRTSIFVQKCPFSCLYCHNPETIHTCIDCGICVDQCMASPKALEKIDGKVVWHEELCIGCDTCIHVCPHSASPKVKLLESKQVFEMIKDYFPYIQGITVSGGECSLYEEFLIELFQMVKQVGKTCFMDTNGWKSFKDTKELLDLCDGVMLDVKAADLNDHMALTGVSNQVVLENLEYLQTTMKLYEVRTVCLPELHDVNERTIRYVASHLDPNIRYKLIKYRPFGVNEKGLRKLGNKMTSQEEILRLKKICEEEYGLKNVIIV